MYSKVLLKWAGSKKLVLPYLLPLLPKAKQLIEPFVGSATVFMNTSYPKYLLADNNSDLINLYTQLQQEGNSFINYCQEFLIPENNQKEKYYEMRSLFNSTKDPRLKSALFIYLNRHSFNGLCRYNSRGVFNVPFGNIKKTPQMKILLLNFLKKSRTAKFLHADFIHTMQLAKKGDVVYCDPPYVPLTKTANFTQYSTENFGEEQQLRLAEEARRLANLGIPVIISNHDTEFTKSLYKGAEIITFTIKRSISCAGNNRGSAKELLAIFS